MANLRQHEVRYRLTGEVFGFLTVTGEPVSIPNKGKGAKIKYGCLCKCGEETIVDASSLKSGKTKSCGCWKAIEIGIRSTTHGYTTGRHVTKEYNTWGNIKSRCNNHKNKKYSDYGGRGIKMHPEWEASFQSFIDSVGLAPSEKHCIDRIDNNRGYEPGNCRWVTQREQCNNKRNNNRIDYNGEALSMMDFSRKYNVAYSPVRYWHSVKKLPLNEFISKIFNT